MSHSYGAVKFQDGLILYCEYNGTSDVMLQRLYKTNQDVSDHWRENYQWIKCNCGKSEPVEICSTYGGGFSWLGMACRNCMIITDRHKPDHESNYSDGISNWYPLKKEFDKFFK